MIHARPILVTSCFDNTVMASDKSVTTISQTPDALLRLLYVTTPLTKFFVLNYENYRN